MRLIFVICANLLLVHKKQCASEGDCYIRGVQDMHWLTAYYNDPVDDFEEKVFKHFLIKNIESVELVGDDYGKYFNAKIKNNHLLILPTDNFRNFEINEKSSNDPIMHVLLNVKCKTGKRQLSFYQPIRDSNTYAPEFDQCSYTYNLPMPLPALFDISAFGSEIVACDMDISNVRLHFANTISEDFSISWSGPVNDTNKCHKAVITPKNPLRLTSSKVYYITVTDTGNPPRNDTATFTVIIDEENSFPLNPQFEHAYYIAFYNSSSENNHYINFENPIRLKEGCSKVNLEILEYKENFRVDCNLNEVQVELIRNLPSDVLKNNRIIAVTIQATMQHLKDPARTVLEVYIEQEPSETSGICANLSSTECPTCSTASSKCSTPIETECPYPFSGGLTHSRCVNTSTTTTTPETPPQSLITFEQDIYVFEARFLYEGYIGAVKAIVIPAEEVEYSVITTPSLSDAVVCDQKSGVFRLTKVLDVEFYTFTAHAEAVKTKVKTEASVQLKINGYDTNSAYNADSIHSLLVEHVTEQMMETCIRLPCPYSYCVYNRKEENYWYYPNNRVSLKYEGKFTYLCVNMIDREQIDVPQITLVLALDRYGTPSDSRDPTDSHVLSKRNIDSEKRSREWVFVQSEIIHITNQLTVLIIIDDINDNAPIFEVGRKLVVGYPRKILAALLKPPYLVQVSATDVDAGENAMIRYSTNSSHFTIHPKTGVVYPDKHTFDDESNLRFVVTATDRNGAEDGLSTDLEIEVKLLTLDHIVAVVIQNIALKDIDVFIQKLSNHTNMTVKYLTAAVIPNCFCNDSSKKHENHFLNYSTRIIVYALNEEDEPVIVRKLHDALHNSSVLEYFEHHKWKLRTSTIDEEYDYDKMEPAISDCNVINAVLVLLLLCFIIAGGVFYYFKVYKNK